MADPAPTASAGSTATQSATLAAASGPSGKRSLFARVDWGAYGVVIATVAIWLVFNAASGGLFLSPRNLTLVMEQGVVVAIVACGMVLVMVTGNIDLSVGSTVGLACVISGYMQVVQGWDTLPTIALVLIVGLAIGIWQGLWVAYVGIPAFIVTLAGMSLFRGAAFVLDQGQSYAPMAPSFSWIASSSLNAGLSVVLVVVAAVSYVLFSVLSSEGGAASLRSIRSVASAIARAVPVLVLLAIVGWVGVSYHGIPVAVLILTAEALLLTFIAHRTRFGRHLYAIGGNREAAILAGVTVSRHIFVVFVGMGLLYSLAGIVLAARMNGAPVDAVIGLELDVITACIIGGTSLFGGIGKIQGAILGVMLLTSLSNGLDLLGFSTYAQFIVKGMVLLLAVLLDVFLKRHRAA